MLTHWKDREPVYRTRERRIRAELGYLPAYAVPIGSAPVDVAPAEPRHGRRSITAPQDPSQVSQERVRRHGARPRDRGAAPAGEHRRDALGARRAAGASRANGGRTGGSGPQPGAGGPAQPGDKPGDGEPPKPKKPRNRKHGRPR